jgi:F0F1-type ATP synthase epsilon subunit
VAKQDEDELSKYRLVVKLFSPFQTYFQGEAVSVSAYNSVGAFDILAGHSNFFSLLTAGDITINTGYQEVKVNVPNGVVRVSNNTVTLFVNI